MRRPRIGVDLGGTKIEIAAFDDGGATLSRRRVASPAGDYAAILDTVAMLVDGVEGQLGRRATVGIGTPGTVSPLTGLMKNANSTVLIGKPFARDVSVRLKRRVRLANDANCFAVSEAVDGAGRGAHCVFGVIVGTGTGGGIVLNGRPLTGRNAIAGEWGHNPLPWMRPDEAPGTPCYCGQRGCIETFVSGPALAREHRADTGVELDARAIAAAAVAGDAAARRSLERYTDRLGRALAGVINVLDPDVVVLGGGLSNIASLYEELPTVVRRYAFSDAVSTPIVPPQHGDSSGVRGAAWLWRVG